jgi:AcrR family transcriptional regulator
VPKLVNAAERRDAVAAVAERVIAARGLGAGLRDVAVAGGWSTSVVTHYFADKRELLEYTLHRTFEGAAARIAARVARGHPRLVAILEENLPLDARRLRQWRLLIAFWGRAVHDPTLEAQQRRRRAGLRAELAAALAEAAPDGAPGFDPAFEARRLFALLDGLAVQAAFEPREWPAPLQIDVVSRHLAELGLPDVLAAPFRTRRAWRSPR